MTISIEDFKRLEAKVMQNVVALESKLDKTIKALELIHDRPDASLSIQAICERTLEQVKT